MKSDTFRKDTAFSMRKTKIVCTIGPASSDEATIGKMIAAGMSVARFNFSHGTHEHHKELIDRVRTVRDRMGAPLAIMLDTKGPEIRLRLFEKDAVVLKQGATFTLTSREVTGNEEMVSISYPDLPRQMKPGTTILIDDGKIHLLVKTANEADIVCTVVEGGEVRSRKSLNIPNFHIDMPYISAADEADLRFAVENDIDFVSASFVRCKEDVIAMRKFLDYYGGHKIRIIAKIENIEGVNNFDEILKYSDGIMVARGDMGVEVEFERLPGLQKRFIRKCYRSGKMVITATQMLESMVHASTPTRAEITDVANAVFDGTSAVMLSGETAMGVNPPHVVSVMARIAEQAEIDAFDLDVYSGMHHDVDADDTTNALCDAACTTARDLGAAAIIAVTKSGSTARRVSKFRPIIPIVAATPEKKTFHQLALSWGVCPVLARNQTDADQLFVHAVDCAKQIDAVKSGDTVVITAGVPLNMAGTTNTLKVSKV